MNTLEHFLSISHELEALKNRVRNFMGGRHWLTDGEWKESVLRTFLRRSMPDTVEIGRGFVISANQSSTQIDVLIYDKSKPVLFRDGDLIFTSPDAVRGIVEVKSTARNDTFAAGIDSLANNAELIHDGIRDRTGHEEIFVGFFAFDFDQGLSAEYALNQLQQISRGEESRIVNHICLGPSWFIRYWPSFPDNPSQIYKSWRSYEFENRASGYFLSNAIEYVAAQSVEMNRPLWYPREGKEIFMRAEKPLQAP